jgi:recombination-promoting nuclease RpnB
MSNLISPHDKLFKITMSRPDVAKEFLQEHLPANIKKLVDLSTLKQEPTEFIDEILQGCESDILYSVHFGHKQGYIYSLFEHLSGPDEMIALRVLRYMICVMEWHWKKTKAKVLCPIYPIIVYPWNTEIQRFYVLF